MYTITRIALAALYASTALQEAARRGPPDSQTEQGLLKWGGTVVLYVVVPVVVVGAIWYAVKRRKG